MDAYPLYMLTTDRTKPVVVKLRMDGKELAMEVDTGAAVSLISGNTYHAHWAEGQAPALQHANVKLRTYTGDEIDVLGCVDVKVVYAGQQEHLRLLVVAGDGPSLLGRDWLSKLTLNWRELNFVHRSPSSPAQTLANVLDQHADVFAEGLGTARGITAKIHVDPQAPPRFCKASPIPYALRDKVTRELERLEKASIIEPVEFMDWAAPVVPVMKKDRSIRLCGDYKLTVNRAAKVDKYPLPRIEDLFAALAGGASFTKLDLAHAYQQIPLDADSRKFVTINTLKGLFQYTRLPFWVSSAPALFQRAMENLLQGLPHVVVYIDDILVTGTTDAEHITNVEEVLCRLEAAGMRLKKSKCAFMLREVEYLGHRITAEGLQPTPAKTQAKTQAIVSAPASQNASQLKSFLGLVNYYAKFLPNLSNTLTPLYALLQKQVEWRWGKAQEEAFNSAKQLLSSLRVLAHFNPAKELLLACDASPYGVGAVLSQVLDDGSDRPVAFASRSLTPAEKRYSQLDKEGLAIIFGVKRFHQYLLGRHFTILSDHKPLQHLFDDSRAIPQMASARLQRWALTLGAYDYSIVYKPGKDHANADMCSRLPLPTSLTETPVPAELVFLMEQLNASPVTAGQVKAWTDKDTILSRVHDAILRGLPFHWDNPEFHPYKDKSGELSVQDGCLLWGSRVVVPTPARPLVIEELHTSHPGIVRMKGLARSYVWWPGMDADLETKVKGCITCQQHQRMPPTSPLHPWEWPSRPWSRIHVDYAGPFLGKMFLVIVDAHSKWLEAHIVGTASSQATIEKLRSTFATHGIPDTVVSDNGSVFTSLEFEDFITKNGIRHARSAPYHPASNGLAERAVQTLKNGLKKMSEGSLETRLSRVLFQYRITPHSTTGQSPAEMLMGRRLHSHLDHLHPDVAKQVRRSQERQKTAHDKAAKSRTFATGDAVWARNYGQGTKWLSGSIVRLFGSHSLVIRLEDGQEVRKHVDQVRQRLMPERNDMPADNHPPQPTEEDFDLLGGPTSDTTEEPEATSGPEALDTMGTVRRSSRVSRPPDRFQNT